MAQYTETLHTVDHIGGGNVLVRPYGARRIAAIGPLNYGVDLGQVGGGGEANIHGGALVELRGRGQSSRRPDKPLPARD